MPTMFDENLMFRTDLTELTALETSVWIDIGQGTPVAGLSARIMVPAATGSTPTLDLVIQASTDESAVAETTVETFTQIIAAGSYEQRFHTTHRYVRMAFDIGSAATNPVFGVVEAGVSNAIDYQRPVS